MNWPQKIKTKAFKLLANHSLNYVFGHFDYTVPKSTLQYWRRILRVKGGPKKSGRPLKFPDLDEDIFNAFILCREKYLPISDSKLVEIAPKVRDEHVEELKVQKNQATNLDIKKNFENTIKELKDMAFSDDWLRQFKKRRHVERRKITTNITKGLSYYKAKLPKWFSNFDKIIAEKNVSTIWNFDETSVLFADCPETTLEIGGKRHIGLASGSNNKLRCTVVLFVNNFGEKMPPIIIIKVPKPRQKIRRHT